MGKEIIKKLSIALVTNPILIIIYWTFFYELALLCKFGRMNHNILILSICVLLFIVIIIFTTIITIKKVEKEEIKSKKSSYMNIWICVSIVMFVGITSVYGLRIYNSAVNYGDKLSLVIYDLKNKRSIKFESDNIYVNGVEGIFNDIGKKYDLPDKLYILDSFKLNFNKEGKITSFETFVYGKDSKEKEKTYLIYYDNKKSDKITVISNNNTNADYNDDKLLKPLISTIKAISIEDTVSNWNESDYGIVYYGKRNWGFNTEGIVNIDEKGNKSYIDISSEIIGYTVSVFVPEKEDKYTPIRYNLKCEEAWSQSTIPPKKDDKKNSLQNSNNDNEEFYLTKEIGYRLNIEDAAAGSRFYSLKNTVDCGQTWKVINEDPFLGKTGVASGIIFINDKLGFLCLSHSGGSNGELYRTEDGGLSYRKVEFPIKEVKLDNNIIINPFDFPTVPYEENDILNMLVGQGQDGDYNGDSQALYQSKDNGATWKFVKELHK
ncbi:hypothetical protein KQI36_10870 [Clostridium senegalense]|uniref:WD40/YVTN/BNR-like repeat-containing protein n=1 Tax=Clostridium senegalense TaxID=1465809 RepID=UPI001C12956B|nr:hypothetical protein [Clostridium senegalense]MBU5227143.1 hypothetical protein [Clostridium senegalense]